MNEARSSDRRRRLLFGGVALSFVAALAFYFYPRRDSPGPVPAEEYAHQEKPARPVELFRAPDFSFRDQHGRPVTQASLAGQPFVANFIFTTCRTICPMLTAKMVRLQRDLPRLPVRFVSFSVDPENDTVEALAAYAKGWSPNETRWLLLETNPSGLAELARGFHISVERSDGGLDAVLHSSVFVLVDQHGVVRGMFDSEDSGDFKALARSVRALLGGDPAPPPVEVRSGEVLFHELSCANCHSYPELAPPLGGLIGKQRELETRMLLTADEAYVRESIVSPAAKRVLGYPLMMPSYAGSVSADELDRLAKYILSLPPPLEPADEGKLAIDPVCHMKVRVTANSLRIELDAGEPAHFCSEWCKKRFSENPSAYPR